MLRPAGSFVMATWASPAVSPAFGTVFGAIKAHADFSVAPPQPDLFAFADPEQARAMMAAAGLALSVLALFALRQNLLVILGVATGYAYLVWGDGQLANIVVDAWDEPEE